MIGYIKGVVTDIFPGGVLLENNGIGYEISLSACAFERLVRDTQGGVYTYLQVREDGLSLFGFDTVEEKKMFLKLISVSGVGPKMGIAILGSMSLKDLAMAIAMSDSKTLSRIKGCGKKTAERIILELRENISSLDLSSSATASPVPMGDESDAVIALMSLGFSRAESEKAVSASYMNGANGVEEIISFALKGLAK